MALYHTTKGPVDYTVVGSPTIVDGVASGFSSSDYVKTEDNLPSNITSLQIHTEAIKANSPSVTYGIFMINGYPSIEFQGSMFRIYVLNQDGTNTPYGYQGEFVNANEKVLVDMYWENGTTRFVAVQNGVTVLDKSYQNTKISSGYVGFGWRWNPLNGSIDLNGTYIKVNGQPWFGLCPVEVQKHRLRGPVGYTVVGSPTINNGLLSVSSNADIVSASAALTYNYNSNIEFYARFKTEDTVNTTRRIIGKNNTTGGNVIWTDVNSVYCLTPDGAGFNPLSWYKLQADTWYRVKVTGNNGTWTIGIYDDNGTLIKDNTKQLTSGTEQSFIPVFNSYYGNHSPQKYLDLNETYIKVNGKLWFYQPADTKYIVKDGKLVWADQRLALGGPVNYEVVGNPTIVDGVASGFSYSNRLNITSNVANSDITEMVWKFKLDTLGLKDNYNFIFYKTGGNLQISIYGNSTRQNFNSPSIYLPGPNLSYLFTNFIPSYDVWYWTKYTYDGTTVRLYSSTDGTNYTLRNTIENVTITGTGGVYQIGWGSSQDPTSTQYFSGSIDLKETYIKVNDQLWFYGKNYATQHIAPVPAGYTFGTTTTPSIGYVDMRTQQFTAAPTGATIGRDE